MGAPVGGKACRITIALLVDVYMNRTIKFWYPSTMAFITTRLIDIKTKINANTLASASAVEWAGRIFEIF